MYGIGLPELIVIGTVIGFLFFFVNLLYKINEKIHTGYKYWQFWIPVYNFALILDMGGQKKIYAYLPLIVGLILILFLQEDATSQTLILLKLTVLISGVVSYFMICRAWANIAEKLGKNKNKYFIMFLFAFLLLSIKDFLFVLEVSNFKDFFSLLTFGGTGFIFFLIWKLANSKVPAKNNR